jgi:hypothetical protein
MGQRGHDVAALAGDPGRLAGDAGHGQPVEIRDERVGALVAQGRVFLEQPQHQRLQVSGQPGHQRARPLHREVDVRGQRFALAHAHERRPAAEHAVQDAAQHIEIGAVIHLAAAATLLGRHVRGRAHDDAGARALLG